MTHVMSIGFALSLLTGFCALFAFAAAARALSGGMPAPYYPELNAGPAPAPAVKDAREPGGFSVAASPVPALRGPLGSFRIKSFGREGGLNAFASLGLQSGAPLIAGGMSKKVYAIRIRGHDGFRRPPAVLDDS